MGYVSALPYILPENLQLLSAIMPRDKFVPLKIPGSLKKLRIDMSASDQLSTDAQIQSLLSQSMQLRNLKELVLNVGDNFIMPSYVRTFLGIAIKCEMRVLAFRGRNELTLLNAHRQQYRRKLLQTALLQRSLFQKSYCRDIILEITELKSEICPIEEL